MIVFDHVNSGAANDLEQATMIARRMVREWGMSDAVGPMAFAGQQQVFLGEDLMTSGREYSDEMARKIDDEIGRILREQEQRARELLLKHRRVFDRRELDVRRLARFAETLLDEARHHRTVDRLVVEERLSD